jgi:hypothetical protein
VRMTRVLKKLLGLCRAVVVCGWELEDGVEGGRRTLVVRVRLRGGQRARCGLCLEVAPLYDRGWGSAGGAVSTWPSPPVSWWPMHLG